jgi:hypothetical protein
MYASESVMYVSESVCFFEASVMYVWQSCGCWGVEFRGSFGETREFWQENFRAFVLQQMEKNSQKKFAKIFRGDFRSYWDESSGKVFKEEGGKGSSEGPRNYFCLKSTWWE